MLRERPQVKPTVDAVGAAQAEVELERTGRAGRPHPCFDRTDHEWEILGMHGIESPPAFQLFESPAEILRHLTVDELGLARGRVCGNETRNAVEDAAKVDLGTFAVVDIGVGSTPLDDCSRCIE